MFLFISAILCLLTGFIIIFVTPARWSIWLVIAILLVILVLNILNLGTSTIFEAFNLGSGKYSFSLEHNITSFIFSIISIITVLLITVSLISDGKDTNDLGLYLIGLGLTLGVIYTNRALYTLIFLSTLQVVIYHLAYKGRRLRDIANLDSAFAWNIFAIILIITGLSIDKGGFGSWASYPLSLPSYTLGSILVIIGLCGLASQPPFHRWMVETTSGRPQSSALVASVFALLPPFYLIMSAGTTIHPAGKIAMTVGSIIGIAGFLSLSAASFIENRMDRSSGYITSALMGLAIFIAMRGEPVAHLAVSLIVLVSVSRLIQYLIISAMDNAGIDRDMRKTTTFVNQHPILLFGFLTSVFLISPIPAPPVIPTILHSISVATKINPLLLILLIIGLFLYLSHFIKLFETTIGGRKQQGEKRGIPKSVSISLLLASLFGIAVGFLLLLQPLLRLSLKV
ncbi:MAG: hypothetical protein DRH51_01665 [Candidatus Coatesbacteria bacterium]|nr:MAG: hypothetical protein DRH51_01665 [Candidatus Coatesbacteria bacterium]